MPFCLPSAKYALNILYRYKFYIYILFVLPFPSDSFKISYV